MKRQTNNKTFKKVMALLLCFAILAAIGIGAYLTDSDVKKDVYTVGNVQAEIISSGDMELNNVGALLPGTVHTYERAAMNTGINDAYVFMSLTIPYEMVGAADDDGTQIGERVRQLFIPGTIGSEWKLVDVGHIGQYEIADNGQNNGEHDKYSAIAGNTITYIYGFIGDNADGALKALKSGETTSNLVDTMELTNLYSASKINGEVSTKLYAIQSNNVNGGLTDVNGVWAVINKALCGDSASEVSTLTYNIANANTGDAVGYAPLKLVDGNGNTFTSVANEEGNGQFQNVPVGEYTIETEIGALTIDNQPATVVLTGEDQSINIDFTAVKNTLVQGILFKNSIPDSVTSVEFVAMPQTYSLADRTVPADAIDVSEAADGSVMAWVEDTTMYVVALDGGMIYANPNSNSMFQDKSNLTYIGTSNLDTSNVVSGEYMFAYCRNLTNTINDFDLSNLRSFEHIFEVCTWVTEFTVPNCVEKIDDYTFSSTGLTSIVIPSNIKEISAFAFNGCMSLTSVTIPESVETIGAYAFCSTGLTSINIPSSVKNITLWYGSPFGGNYSLTAINVDPANECYASVDGVLFDKDMKTLVQYPAGKINAEYTVPTGVEIIGDYAFTENTNLTSVVIPDGVTTIGQYAFNRCVSLTTINIPTSTTTFGGYAFDGTQWFNNQKASGEIITINGIWVDASTATGDIVIPEGMTSISGSLLSNNANITSVVIPASVEVIEDNAFANCSSLTTVTFAEGSQLKSIGAFAFGCCSNLSTITLPDSITSMGNVVFAGCSNLTSINIPANMISLNNASAHNMFNGSCITSVTIPNSVTDIGNGLANCSNLTEIVVADDHPTLCVVDGVLFNKNITELICYPAGKTDVKYVVPDSVTTLGNGAFMGNTYLEEVVLPIDVNTINGFCFQGCENLKTINFCGTQAQWNQISFGVNWNDRVHPEFKIVYDYVIE